jgi:hypothetical protein
VQVRIGGERYYGGVVDSWQEGIEEVARIKRKHAAEQVHDLTPNVPKRIEVSPPWEPPWGAFGR